MLFRERVHQIFLVWPLLSVLFRLWNKFSCHWLGNTWTRIFSFIKYLRLSFANKSIHQATWSQPVKLRSLAPFTYSLIPQWPSFFFVFFWGHKWNEFHCKRKSASETPAEKQPRRKAKQHSGLFTSKSETWSSTPNTPREEKGESHRDPGTRSCVTSEFSLKSKLETY